MTVILSFLLVENEMQRGIASFVLALQRTMRHDEAGTPLYELPRKGNFTRANGRRFSVHTVLRQRMAKMRKASHAMQKH